MSDSRICFFAESHLGIGTAAAAMKPYLVGQGQTVWVDVTYQYACAVGPLPELAVGGALAGFLQTGAALSRERFGALGFLTHNPAVLRQLTISRTPTLLWTDVTPALLDRQADDYEHRVDGRVFGRVKHALVRRAFHKARLCVGWSEWARQSFVTDYGVPEHRTAVVPPGIDLTKWQPTARGIRAGSLPRLLFVGGHFARKGGELLLEVFRQRFRDRATLDVVTRDPVGEEPGVRVHRGLTADSTALKNLYDEADAFVLPTMADCFSIASLEAMAMRLPVVLSAVGGTPDIVDSGATGFLIQSGDGAALGDAIEALVSDRARAFEMGRRGRMVVETRFDARTTASRLLQLLISIRTNSTRAQWQPDAIGSAAR